MGPRVVLYTLLVLVGLAFLLNAVSACACGDGGAEDNYTVSGMVDRWTQSHLPPAAQLTPYAHGRFPERVDVDGLVVDSKGNRIPGAKIFAGPFRDMEAQLPQSIIVPKGGSIAQSRDETQYKYDQHTGAFTLSVARGPMLVIVSKEGYETFDGSFEAPLPNGEHLVLTLVRPNEPHAVSRTVDGLARDEDGKAVDGVYIEIAPQNGEVAARIESNAKGEFQLPYIPGIVHIRGTKDGFTPADGEIELPTNEKRVILVMRQVR